MKTSTTARSAALFASILVTFTAIHLIAAYALPADAPVRLALATNS